MASEDQKRHAFQHNGHQGGLPGGSENRSQHSKKRNNRLFWGLVSIGLIFSLGLCGVTGLIAYNANRNGLISLPVGNVQLAQMLPQETQIYGSIDLLNLQSAEMKRIVDTYDVALDRYDFPDGETVSLPTEFDQMLQETFNMTAEADITPWIGRHIEFGIIAFNLPDAQGSEADDEAPVESPFALIDLIDLGGADQFEAIFALESRDSDAADRFIEKVKIGLEKDESVTELTSRVYQETPYYIANRTDGSILSFGRVENLVLFTVGAERFQQSINLQQSDTNLAGLSSFQTAFNQLPGERFATFYFDGARYFDLLNDVQQGLGNEITINLSELSPVDLDFVALSLTAESEGVAVDLSGQYLTMSDFQRSLIETSANVSRSTISFLPETTFFFFSGASFAPAYGEMWDRMANDPAIEEIYTSIDESAADFGFHPTDQLLPLLDGDFVIGAAHTVDGNVNQQSGLEADLLAFFKTSDVEEVGNLAIAYADTMRQDGYGINPNASNGLNIFNISDEAGEPFPLVYGVGNGYLTLSTSPAEMEAAFTGRPSIYNNGRYQAINGTLPETMVPYFYFNLRAYLQSIEPEAGEDGEASDQFQLDLPAELGPIEAMIAGQRFDSEANRVNGRMMLIISEGYATSGSEQRAEQQGELAGQ